MSLTCSIAVQLTLILCCSLTHVVADLCNPNPCKNGSCRTPYQGGYNWGYICSCFSGFFGSQCQWDNIKCHNDTVTPCQNGKCVDTDDGRFCVCPLANNRTIKYGGHYCELVDPCETCPDGYKYCQSAPNRVSGCVCLNERHEEMPPAS